MAAAKRRGIFRRLFLILLGIGIAGLCLYFIFGRHGGASAGLDREQQIYLSDGQLEPAAGVLIPGLIPLTPEQIVRAPLVDGFQAPCGAPGGAMMYDAQPFGADNPARGGYHTGQDINGIGGENSDLGEPVYAAARGLVVYSNEPSPGWGNVVVLAHRLPGTDRIIQTLYAHLAKRDVRVGQLVSRGQRIGSIGTAGGRYLAHLHFEAIESLSTEAGMPGYHPAGTMNRLDPQLLMQQYPAPALPDMYEEIRRFRIREAYSSQTQKPSATSPSVPQGTIPVNPSQFITP